jgi:hypothetical protein
MDTSSACPWHLEPASVEEVSEILAENGVESVDEEPAGATEFHGYGELISELERSLASSEESAPTPSVS